MECFRNHGNKDDGVPMTFDERNKNYRVHYCYCCYCYILSQITKDSTMLVVTQSNVGGFATAANSITAIGSKQERTANELDNDLKSTLC